jgi:hypothetical protein
MLVANLVVETLPGKAHVVLERLGRLKGMTAVSGDGDHRITATWSVPDIDSLEGLCEVLQALNPEIIGVSPTPVEGDS